MAGTLIGRALGTFVALVVLAGCATGDARLMGAIDAGRWDEAASLYAERLAADPDRLETRVGLGVARYKLGSWDEAVAALEPAVARAPGHAYARLYLGLARLQQGDLGRADEHLTAYRALARDPRVAAQVDQALRLLRAEPLSVEARGFLATSLEIEAMLAREADEARRYAQANLYWGPPFWGYYYACWPYRDVGRFACW